MFQLGLALYIVLKAKTLKGKKILAQKIIENNPPTTKILNNKFRLQPKSILICSRALFVSKL